jgi:hypothetical protein
MKDGKILHTLDERFGFRTVELKKGNGLYVNGRKIMFKGVNRHSFWPNSGRCLSRQLSITDVNLMKDMNMNAVRMSHYPPDKHFLEVCDSLGLFVLNELAGWQDSYDTPTGEKLVKEMVTRDVNHPCVILWDNGNEGGNNTELDDDFAKYDPQNRPVIHPWEIFNGTDTQHYKSFNYGPGSMFHGREVFFPTEFLHGLYDGGHGAGLDDYWNLMMEHPLSAGGFLWDFADEAVVRTDKKGVLDTDKNHAADGILGPYREKEASFYTIKEIWSPIFINKRFITKHFDGRILLENRYFYTGLNECQFIRKLVDFSGPFEPSAGHRVRLKKTLHSPAIQPGERGLLDLDLPQDWQSYDALYLTVIDPHGRMIYTWSFPIITPREMTESIIENNSSHNIKVEQDSNLLYLSSGDTQIRIDKQTGMLIQVENCKSLISFTNGPKPNHKDLVMKSLKHFRHNNDYIVEIDYEEGLEKLVWTLKRNGWLKLEYSYQPARGEYDVLGINFNYPEEKVTGMKWLGRGPYRVWKNRLKGQMFDVWSKQYNNTVTGESWNYPEFKGYHAEFNWVVIENTESPFIIATSTPDLFLRVFTPQPPAGAYNDHTSPSFPAGDISILHGIDAIGTKFKPPELLGPASMKNRYEGHGKNTLSACLFFYFGHMD